MASAEWKRPALEVLLKLYREHPILYDMRHSKYYNKTERQKALNTIIDMLEDHRPGTTTNDILRKIQSMRTQFGQELSKLKRKQSNGQRYVPTVWWYNYLSFLKIHIKPRSAVEEDEIKLSISHQPSEGEFESYTEESLDFDGESEIIYEIQSAPKGTVIKTDSSDSKLQNGSDKEEVIYEITQANTVVPKRKLDLSTSEELRSPKQPHIESGIDESSVQSNSGADCSAGRKSEVCEVAVDGDRCHSLGRFVTSQMASIRDDYLFYATQMDVLNIINKAQLKQLLIDKDDKTSN
ncbi:uncharacterized protein LOC129729039 [Wyeomyia smithii]|uniref:uncharacterized protein LOC129729039 n=1 Tax=Wyeomyia smithii TaxID=174621 RepID=UPI002467F58B|nr:uncharacterized protein LOC129729039 [Wyeomyia smithii]